MVAVSDRAHPPGGRIRGVRADSEQYRGAADPGQGAPGGHRERDRRHHRGPTARHPGPDHRRRSPPCRAGARRPGGLRRPPRRRRAPSRRCWPGSSLRRQRRRVGRPSGSSPLVTWVAGAVPDGPARLGPRARPPCGAGRSGGRRGLGRARSPTSAAWPPGRAPAPCARSRRRTRRHATAPAAATAPAEAPRRVRDRSRRPPVRRAAPRCSRASSRTRASPPVRRGTPHRADPRRGPPRRRTRPSDDEAWSPVPVPRPTYTMKASAPRREPAPLENLEGSTAARTAEVEAPADHRARPARAAGGDHRQHRPERGPGQASRRGGVTARISRSTRRWC